MDKLNMQTTNIVDENIKRIGELFPNCLTERLNAEGRPEVAIDFDQLRQELSKDIVEGAEERYQFTWPDKRNAIRLANAPTTDTLRPCREESVDFDNTKNLYIEGDNLQVLKLLRENYLGKVKMIYIDPPYNTGNDFVYNDDFSQSAGEYMHNSGQEDEEGNRLVANTESNGRFHTDWLNMIYPRLKVAKDLLSDDGVIFISIDDNEQENLKCVCNEVLGAHNFIAQLVWERAFAPKNDARFVSNSHDYVLMYAKNLNDFVIGRLDRTEEANARYSNPDNDPRGPWTSGDISVKTYSASTDYPITLPSGRVVNPPSGGCWRLSKDAYTKYVKENRIWFGPKGDNTPRIKRFLSELKFEGMAPTSILFYKDVGHSQEGAKEVVALLDKGVFDGPKPVRLLKRLLTLANLKEDSIVLDFFSGSGSTAHALMSFNAEKQKNCKFILVQLPEDTDEKAKVAGFNTIPEIGKERIRRAGKKIKEESPLTTQKLDVGFRVLKLDSSNMQDVYYTPAEFNDRDLFEENIKPDRKDEDLLFQCMIELGIELSAKIEKKSIAGKSVWSVSDGYLMACFDKEVNETTITEIARQQPYYFVMRDSSLANDQVADNFEQIFNHYSKDTIRRIL
ncbi:site-specific DNA-methyltransferase [Segatella bryantii]|uniref:site-specific DNA-methyltransferase n=1 Tax=Segatella bryantii TaxID=77095 RepID=UPI00241C0F2C|nr:site-specific DNA-methyltransferase [Segatella bryantii]